MELIKKLDLFVNDEISSGDVATNTAKGKIDVVGGKCPDGQIYDKIKKVCVPVKNESSVVGGSYLDGTSVNIIGSQQTRAVGRKYDEILDLARKEPVEDEFDDPTDTNILGRKGLKFDMKTGSYIPSIWGDNE